jgi:hypothetical protein
MDGTGDSESQGSGFDSLREHHQNVEVRLKDDKGPSADWLSQLRMMPYTYFG